tara:strand:- start:365 stop:574 length:210 start_codon:yes stop_codon:yes gene_type:complete
MSKEFEKALLRYLSLEKFISIVPLTLTLFIVNRFSSLKLFEFKKNKNMIIDEIIKIYRLKKVNEFLNNK